MVTEQLFVRPDSWRPWQHYGFAVPLVNPSLGRYIHVNVNDFGADASLGSASGSCVGVILGKVTGPGIVRDQIG